jgi:hypothetical protein
MYKILFISFIVSIVFGIIDSTLFLVAEDTIQKYISQKFNFLSQKIIELITGALSASISIFFATLIGLIIENYYSDLIKNPFIDAFGIILGTTLVIIIYKLTQKIIPIIKHVIHK